MKRQDRRLPDIKTTARMRELEEFAVRPKTREEERELYSGFYERLYEYFHKGRIDFTYLADRLGLRERRIRECLLFRLSSGEVMQLFGLRKGHCFVCESRLFANDTPEPICLRCLNAFEKLLEEQYGKIAAPNPEFRGRFITGDKTGTEFRVQRVDENTPPPACPRPEDLPDVQQASEKPGEQTASTPDANTPNPEASQQPERMKKVSKEGKTMRAEDDDNKPQNAPKQPDDHEFLAMLELDESQVPAPEVQLPDAVVAGEPLRHYGFKRSAKKA